jgi:hypothetical protein
MLWLAYELGYWRATRAFARHLNRVTDDVERTIGLAREALRD